MKAIINLIAWILVVVGALNWGLVGLFSFNLVETIFGVGTLSKVVYDIVGLAAVVLIILKVMKK